MYPHQWRVHHLGELSNEKNPGWLGYIGDEILPNYIGIIISHYKDAYKPVLESNKVFFFFFAAQLKSQKKQLNPFL